MIRDIPVMRRPVGQHAHPLLIDQVVYVKAGRTEAETERRIAEACAASAIDPARAVACVAAPPEGKRGIAKGSSKATPRKPANGPCFERREDVEGVRKALNTRPISHTAKATS